MSVRGESSSHLRGPPHPKNAHVGGGGGWPGPTAHACHPRIATMLGGAAGGGGQRRVRRRASGGVAAATAAAGPRVSKRRRTHETGGSGGRWRCSYCARDVGNSWRIKCAVCQDVTLCVECFSVGVEIFPHTNDHAYRVVERLDFEAFAAGWTADEELLLLEGLENLGFERWDAVAEHIGSKTSEQCRAHYTLCFLDGSAQAPLPDTERLVPREDEQKAVREAQERRSKNNKGRRGRVRVRAGGRACGRKGRGAWTATDRSGWPRAVTKEMAASRLANDEVRSVNTAGYHAKREDFEEEWDNDADKNVGSMEFLHTDSKDDVELKLQVLEIYNHKLDERERYAQPCASARRGEQPPHGLKCQWRHVRC
jgi:hypothetical protein